MSRHACFARPIRLALPEGSGPMEAILFICDGGPFPTFVVRKTSMGQGEKSGVVWGAGVSVSRYV